MTASDETSVISFHRLHYGKLAEGEDRRVTTAGGYAITRRSAGLDPGWDSWLSPPRLAELRRFEPDAIDIDARATGCFLARTVGEGVVFMRARFRPEGSPEHGVIHDERGQTDLGRAEIRLEAQERDEGRDGELDPVCKNALHLVSASRP